MNWQARNSQVGRLTSRRKLYGQFDTPLVWAKRMLSRVRWPEPLGKATLLDPACGDGVFLQAAVNKVLRLELPAQTTREILRGIQGWEIDSRRLHVCRTRLQQLLTKSGYASAGLELVHCDSLTHKAHVSCVVGNPPYLEAKRMSDDMKQRLRRLCPLAAHGAFDLYGAFVEKALSWVSDDGEICLLIPNRFLVAAYAEPLRQEILATRKVTVVDLSKEKVFADAAVYPVILHVTPGGQRRAHGPFIVAASRHSEKLKASLRVFSDSRCRPLSDVADVRWTVSFHRAGLRDRFVFTQKPQYPGAIPKKFLGGGRFAGNREVDHGAIRWIGTWIDYDEARARAEANPFPPLSLFEQPKVVVCQNARRCRAAVDHQGYILKDTFLAIIPKPGQPLDLLDWIACVLNSELFHTYYEHRFGGTRKRGGYLHFLPRYLRDMLLPSKTMNLL